MAVAPTGAIYKALEFDGVSSRTYGVYITGEAVYNAPERDVEMVTIPGRNGTYALDNGRFENIEVSYPAGIFAETETDFRQAISEFRNFLCSRKGYVRLQDEYNPDEYRMAVYKSGLEVDPAMLRAGEFDIVFDCKPQRFLTSGETKQTIANSGDTLTNPTLFEASPLLQVEGYGAINIGGGRVVLNNAEIGAVILNNPYSFKFTKTWNFWFTFNTDALNTGDDIFFPEQKITMIVSVPSSESFAVGWVDDSNLVNIVESSNAVLTSKSAQFIYTLPSVNFTYGTPATSPTSSGIPTLWDGSTGKEMEWSAYVTYNGSNRVDGRIVVDRSYGVTLDGTNYRPETTAYSTKSILGNVNFVDLDIGEAWTEESGSIISINNVVELPAKLPTLASGSNGITFDNTITDLKVVPRWWKI